MPDLSYLIFVTSESIHSIQIFHNGHILGIRIYEAKVFYFTVYPWDLHLHIGYVLKFQKIYLISSPRKACGKSISHQAKLSKLETGKPNCDCEIIFLS